MTFRHVSDVVRWQLADAYLTHARAFIAEVAGHLGFSEERSFDRAFQRRPVARAVAAAGWRVRPTACAMTGCGAYLAFLA